jgi:monothiol glutaredoxin
MDIEAALKQQITDNAVLLFMKGTPDFPQCGFSSQVAGALKETEVPFSYINILENPEAREKLKEMSNWPTYPQLYVGGELLGGCDIIIDMYNEGELKPALEAAEAAQVAKA